MAPFLSCGTAGLSGRTAVAAVVMAVVMAAVMTVVIEDPDVGRIAQWLDRPISLAFGFKIA